MQAPRQLTVLALINFLEESSSYIQAITFPMIYKEHPLIMDINNWLKNKTPHLLIQKTSTRFQDDYSIILCNHWREQLWLYIYENYDIELLDIIIDSFKLNVISNISNTLFFEKKYICLNNVNLDNINLDILRIKLIRLLVKLFKSIPYGIHDYEISILYQRLIHSSLINFINKKDLIIMRMISALKLLYSNHNFEVFNERIKSIQSIEKSDELYNMTKIILNKVLRWKRNDYHTLKSYELIKSLNILEQEDIDYFDKRFAKMSIRIMSQ